jgi:hypothetical protein
MKQIITTRNQTTISIVQGDNQVFIQTSHDSPSLIQVNTNGIHIQIQTGGGARVNPGYDTYEELAPMPLPGPFPEPIKPVKPVKPVGPTELIKPKFNIWPFTKSAKLVSDLKIPTTEFVRLALKWCETHIEKPKHHYTFEVKYYQAKKVHGTYQFASRKITVYAYPSLKLKSLCETLIHEYSHHLHIRTQADQSEYDRLKRKHGYYQNPHEVSARSYEAAYGKALYDYMKEMVSS